MKVADIAELLLLAVLWGGSFLFMRVAAPVLGPVWLIELRVLLAGLALLPLLIRSKHGAVVRAKAMPLLIVGCFNSALPFLLLAFASVSLPAGFTSILNATTPLFGTVVAVVWLKERPTLGQMIGLGVGFAGVVVLVGLKSFVATTAFVMACVAGLMAAVMYAIAAPYIKQQLAGVPSLVIATISQLSAALFLIPALPFTIPKTLPTPTVWLSVLALALFSTSLAYILYFRLIHNVGSTQALTVTYLIPAFAMAWGALLLNEPITLSMTLGGALVLLGTAIANGIFNRFWPKTDKPKNDR
ncbi:MAG: DMT family transporter, partial [Phormidesmis sp. RL_2_1]|nr:DMT family transporter [Phormidesmis sp. RL_2_1]